MIEPDGGFGRIRVHPLGRRRPTWNLNLLVRRFQVTGFNL